MNGFLNNRRTLEETFVTQMADDVPDNDFVFEDDLILFFNQNAFFLNLGFRVWGLGFRV